MGWVIRIVSVALFIHNLAVQAADPGEEDATVSKVLSEDEQGSNSTWTMPAKEQMLLQTVDQQSGSWQRRRRSCGGSASECCTGIPAKDWPAAVRGEAAGQGVEQYSEAMFLHLATWTTKSGKTKTLPGAGAAGAYLGSIAGSYISETMMDDPYAPQFAQISKHMDCLADKIDENTRKIEILAGRITKVEQLATLNAYEISKLKSKSKWKEGLSAKALIADIKGLHHHASNCVECLIGIQPFPADLKKRLAPEFGKIVENNQPMSRQYGLQCDADNRQCNTNAFLDEWINDARWQGILDNLVELVMFTKYNWHNARTTQYHRRRVHRADPDIVGGDAEDMAIVVKTVPLVLGLIQQTASAVRMWGNVLAASISKDNEDDKINILARTQRFYTALVKKPFHLDSEHGRYQGSKQVQDLTDLWQEENADVGEYMNEHRTNACACMGECGCNYRPLTCGAFCTPAEAKGWGYALSKDGKQCGCAHPTCNFGYSVAVGASPRQLGAGCYNEFGDAFHLLKAQKAQAEAFDASGWILETDYSTWRLDGSSASPTPAAGSVCPTTHPFAYRRNFNYDYCCKTETNWPGKSKWSRSDVCAGHEFTQCPKSPCDDNPNLALTLKMCPSSHPYAYRGNCCNYDYCCENDKNWPNTWKQGRGDVCFGHKFVRCPRAPCDDYHSR